MVKEMKKNILNYQYNLITVHTRNLYVYPKNKFDSVNLKKSGFPVDNGYNLIASGSEEAHTCRKMSQLSNMESMV